MRRFVPIQTHMIRSRYVAEQVFKIQVMLPPHSDMDARRFPVVYMTDGNAAFDMLKGISWMLQQSDQESLGFMLIAISYPSESPIAGALLRGRDLTFPGTPNVFSGLEFPWDGVLRSKGMGQEFGGAANFQRFIAEELVDFIDERYKTEVGHRTYFGHSAGGSFGLFTLLTRPELFRNYIISSPALTYHGTTPDGTIHDNDDFLLQRVRDFTVARESLGAVQLYISVGGQEQYEPLIGNWQMVSSFYRLVALLKQAEIPGLRLASEVFAGESHVTAWPIAFMHGIQSVFGTRRVLEHMVFSHL
jgi:predicted alpha/beta superfamily hydrolase